MSPHTDGLASREAVRRRGARRVNVEAEKKEKKAGAAHRLLQGLLRHDHVLATSVASSTVALEDASARTRAARKGRRRDERGGHGGRDGNLLDHRLDLEGLGDGGEREDLVEHAVE